MLYTTERLKSSPDYGEPGPGSYEISSSFQRAAQASSRKKIRLRGDCSMHDSTFGRTTRNSANCILSRRPISKAIHTDSNNIIANYSTNKQLDLNEPLDLSPKSNKELQKIEKSNKELQKIEKPYVPKMDFSKSISPYGTAKQSIDYDIPKLSELRGLGLNISQEDIDCDLPPTPSDWNPQKAAAEVLNYFHEKGIVIDRQLDRKSTYNNFSKEDINSSPKSLNQKQEKNKTQEISNYSNPTNLSRCILQKCRPTKQPNPSTYTLDKSAIYTVEDWIIQKQDNLENSRAHSKMNFKNARFPDVRSSTSIIIGPGTYDDLLGIKHCKDKKHFSVKKQSFGESKRKHAVDRDSTVLYPGPGHYADAKYGQIGHSPSYRFAHTISKIEKEHLNSTPGFKLPKSRPVTAHCPQRSTKFAPLLGSATSPGPGQYRIPSTFETRTFTPKIESSGRFKSTWGCAKRPNLLEAMAAAGDKTIGTLYSPGPAAYSTKSSISMKKSFNMAQQNHLRPFQMRKIEKDKQRRRQRCSQNSKQFDKNIQSPRAQMTRAGIKKEDLVNASKEAGHENDKFSFEAFSILFDKTRKKTGRATRPSLSIFHKRSVSVVENLSSNAAAAAARRKQKSKQKSNKKIDILEMKGNEYDKLEYVIKDLIRGKRMKILNAEVNEKVTIIDDLWKLCTSQNENNCNLWDIHKVVSNYWPLLNEKLAYKRAFKYLSSQNKTKETDEHEEIITRNDFSYLIRNIFYFSKLWFKFSRNSIGDDEDRTITFSEFCAYLHILRIHLDDDEAEAAFAFVDRKCIGKGLFNLFVLWVAERNIPIPGTS